MRNLLPSALRLILGWPLIWFGLVVFMSGCSSIQREVSEYKAEQAAGIQDYVVVYPKTKASSPAIREFVDWKRELGFTVHEISFNTHMTAWKERKLEVRDKLAALETTPGRLVYLLIIASSSDLQMGGWKVEDMAIGESYPSTDLPLLTDADLESGQPLSWQVIKDGFNSKYIPARLPFEEEAVLAKAVASSKAYYNSVAPTPPSQSYALLGAETHTVKHDTSIVMKRAKRVMTKHGYDAELWSSEAPRDVALGGDPSWLEHWAATSPSLVYAIAHGDAYMLGEELISEAMMDEAMAQQPDNPAVFLTFGCSMGDPGSMSGPSIVNRLFREGYIAAIGCSTELTGPEPLATGVGAELNIARAATSDLTLGLAIRATKQRYVEKSPLMPGFLSKSVKQTYILNIAGIGMYGDPSLPLPTEP